MSWRSLLLAILLAVLGATPLLGPAAGPCPALAQDGHTAQEADALYRQGLRLQKEQRTLEAIEAYKQALKFEPFLARAHWELGWSYWVLGKWPEVVRHWEIAQDLKLDEPDLAEYLTRARDQLSGKGEPLVHVPIGTTADSKDGALKLELIARFQHYDPDPESPTDHFDRYVFSPKAVHFTDGKVYVNALEGFATLVFDPATLERRKVIGHVFGEGDGALFAGQAGEPWASFSSRLPVPNADRFSGKPVEFAETHGGRYLWVSYYRRDFDPYGVMPSAVAVIDTRSDAIVRVIDTGPIPKFLAASPDGHWLAVIHWGDNTVGLIDVSGDTPETFRRAGLITVGKRLSLDGAEDVDRDHYCGYCLRGAVFTADSRHLLVGRMGGGGIAVIDVPAQRYLGTVMGMKPTPRQLVLSADGSRLWVGSNMAGYVSLYRTADLVAAAEARQMKLPPLEQGKSGIGTRTIALSPDGTLIYAAVNNESKLVVLDSATLAKRLEIPADSYPVGLAVSPDGTRVWVTSQGRKLRGGNSVSIYRVTRTAPR